MWTAARFSRVSFALLFVNAALVLAVAALRPVLAYQTAEPPSSDSRSTEPGPPAVEVPPAPVTSESDPIDRDSLPSSDGLYSNPSSTGAPIPPSLGGVPSGPPNGMVLDEMRKLIQEGRADLDVPALSFPPLSLKSSTQPASADLEELSQRMRTIAALTQSAQALIKEAQHLHANGKAAAAAELTEHARTLKIILAQLAASKAVADSPSSVTR